MALVLLPCDLPTWPTLQRHLNSLKQVRDTVQLKDALFKIHSLCKWVPCDLRLQFNKIIQIIISIFLNLISLKTNIINFKNFKQLES